MGNFIISGQGGALLPKARALPAGAKVRIAEAGIHVDHLRLQEIRGGTRAGQKIPTHKLRVVYEALDSGTTQAYTYEQPGKPTSQVQAVAFKPGDRFVIFYGGVYPKGEEFGKDVTLTQKGSAYRFVKALLDLGVEPTGDFSDYVGHVVTLRHREGTGPTGDYVQVYPATVDGKHPGFGTQTTTATATAPQVGTNGGNPLLKKPAVPSINAFAALSQADQASILEAVAQGPLSPAELVAVGIAPDEATAAAILAAVPAQKVV